MLSEVLNIHTHIIVGFQVHERVYKSISLKIVCIKNYALKIDFNETIEENEKELVENREDGTIPC